MKNAFESSQKIGEIATRFPKVKDIFMEYKIDFCCGGDRSLSTALKEQNINESEILEKINIAYENHQVLLNYENIDWSKSSLTELIDYIVDKHHTFLKKEFPDSSELLNKILRVHFVEHREILTKLHKLFNQLKSEIEQHLIKEEEILFPLIKKYENNPSRDNLKEVVKVSKEIENEHENAGGILKEMRKITNNYQVPSDGCGSFVRCYEKLQEIEGDLFQHIHLENNILFEKLNQKNM